MRLRDVLLEHNVRNTAAIDSYLQRFVVGIHNEAVRKFFLANVKRWIINNDAELEKSQHVTDSDPEWAHQAFAQGDLYDFVGSHHLEERLTHVLTGIHDIMEKRPALLDRIGNLSLEGVENIIDDFYAKQMNGEVVPLQHGEKAIIDYRDGSRWVQITSPQALSAEGAQMGHCVGGYGNRLSDGDHFFSLRDSKNRPHITVHAIGKRLSQVKGRQNRPPVAKYIPYVIDFLNKLHFEQSCYDLDNYDVVKKGDRWTMFDPLDVEVEKVAGFDVRFARGSAYVRLKSGEDIKLETRSLSYDPRLPDVFYREIVQDFGASPRWDFDDKFLNGHRDDLHEAVETLKIITPGSKYAYKSLKGVEYVVNQADGQHYWVKDGDKFYTMSASTPAKYLLTMAVHMGLPLNQSLRLSVLGSMSAAAAAKLAPKLKVLNGTNASLTFSSPDMRRLPDGLNVPNTLFIKPECGLRRLPNNMKVRRDLNLAGTNIEVIGDNTHVRRTLKLGGSKVKKLPKGLKIGGGTELRGALDLRGSLITEVPEDLELLSQPPKQNKYYGTTTMGRSARIIISPEQAGKIRIPKRLEGYVEVKRYVPAEEERND